MLYLLEEPQMQIAVIKKARKFTFSRGWTTRTHFTPHNI